jgi:hypothetical protein
LSRAKKNKEMQPQTKWQPDYFSLYKLSVVALVAAINKYSRLNRLNLGLKWQVRVQGL